MSNKYIYWKWGKGNLMKKSYRKKEDNNQKEDTPNIITDRMDLRDRNTREINSERMSQRELLIQTSINPFLSNSNYLNDLKTQNDFLRPKNSSYEKI